MVSEELLKINNHNFTPCSSLNETVVSWCVNAKIDLVVEIEEMIVYMGEVVLVVALLLGESFDLSFTVLEFDGL